MSHNSAMKGFAKIIAEREKMRVDNPDMFAHVWLGQPLTKQDWYGVRQADSAEIEGHRSYRTTQARIRYRLGIGDSTAIWFRWGKIHFIDHYESSGEELGHYISIIKNKPYNYTTHFLPHDAKQRATNWHDARRVLRE